MSDSLDCSEAKARHVGFGMECAVARFDAVSWFKRCMVTFLLRLFFRGKNRYATFWSWLYRGVYSFYVSSSFRKISSNQRKKKRQRRVLRIMHLPKTPGNLNKNGAIKGTILSGIYVSDRRSNTRYRVFSLERAIFHAVERK